MLWLNQILQGVLLGGYYALLACGLSFMFGVMRIINLAHGSLAVLAAFAIWLLGEHLHWSPFAALALVVPAMALLGWLLQRLVLERSARGGALVPILSTFGLAIVLDNLLFQQFGADTRSLAPFIGDLAFDGWELPGGLFVGQLPVLIFVIAVALLGGLQVLLSRTRLGREIRATSEDPDTVGLLGIAARRVHGAAAMLALATVAVAGLALGLRATFDPYAGAIQLIFAFEAVIIGGTGSLWGTLFGGMALGVAQSLGAQAHPQGFLIAGHGLFLVALLARLYVVQRWHAVVRALRRPRGTEVIQ